MFLNLGICYYLVVLTIERFKKVFWLYKLIKTGEIPYINKMAKPKKKSNQASYESMRDAFMEVENYEASLEKAKENFQVSNAAVQSAGRKSPEAARALQQADQSRHNMNFLEAGLNDSRKGFEKDFLKDRKGLEAILGNKDVSKTLKNAVFSYEPSVPKGASQKYQDAAKLHKKIVPMLARYSTFRGKQLSKDQEDAVFEDMARDVIADYVRHEKDPLYLRAFVELAGGVVEQDKDGKLKIVQDKEGNIAIGSNGIPNKQFVGLRYEGIIEERTNEFMDIVEGDLPRYIAATLPDKYEKAKGFYANVVNSVESKKQEAKKKKK